jgi:peptidoglycan/xylan/chitin deacetylase (PgdA/CDA1 family)
MRKLVVLAGLLIVAASSMAAAQGSCPRPGTLGVSRTVEIDTTGGPGFGMQHYKAYDFLQPKEVVLTFDDGPQKFSTEMVLAALADQCTKATFFSIGKMALGYPEIIREVAKAGHTIGTHTWSHAALAKLKTFEEGKDEIERGISAVKRAVGGPIAPFFRFPTLKDTPEAVAYLGTRNIAMFSTDIDSFDFKPQNSDHIVKSVMSKLEKMGKGIILMHDIHKTTAKALPALLAELNAKGYKIVHLTAKSPVTTVAEYDNAIEKDAKGLPQVGAERPLSSIVRTVGEEPAKAEAPAPTHAASTPSQAAEPVEPTKASAHPHAEEPMGEGASEEEPVGEGGATESGKPAGIQEQKATPATSPKPSTTAAASPAVPAPAAAPHDIPHPVATPPAAQPAAPAAAAASAAPTAAPAAPASPASPAPTPVASPSNAIPPPATLTTSSVVRTVDGSAPPTATNETGSPAASPAPPAPPAPIKTLGQRAKEIWELWFGQ